MIIIGLTGSIGMGKTVAANMLQSLGVPVHDSDAAVHKLMEEGGAGNIAVRAAFPYPSYTKIYGRKNTEGARPIDRNALGKLVFKKPKEREKLEAVLHPLVRQAQAEFIRRQNSLRSDIVALDIPLLFETGAENRTDYVITVSAPYFIQKARVLARPGMTREKFAAILARQMPDEEKRARADFVVHTGLGRAHTMKQLKKILMHINKNKEGKDLKEGEGHE